MVPSTLRSGTATEDGYLTTNGKTDTYGLSHPFALSPSALLRTVSLSNGYRRVNGTFYETISLDPQRKY